MNEVANAKVGFAIKRGDQPHNADEYDFDNGNWEPEGSQPLYETREAAEEILRQISPSQNAVIEEVTRFDDDDHEMTDDGYTDDL